MRMCPLHKQLQSVLEHSQAVSLSVRLCPFYLCLQHVGLSPRGFRLHRITEPAPCLANKLFKSCSVRPHRGSRSRRSTRSLEARALWHLLETPSDRKIDRGR